MVASISFVIPAYNEQHFIDRCLQAIFTHCREQGVTFETIVVDNGSTDSTSEIARRAGVKVVRTNRTTVSSARNLGASQATSDVIAFLDADVLITDRWVAAVRRLLASDHPARLLTGFQVVIREDGSWIEKVWFGRLKDNHINAGNLLMTRSAFESVSGFDETLKTGEDYDICKRAVNAGVVYSPDPELEAVHLGYPTSLRGFVRREIWHGEGDFRSWRHFVTSPVAILGIGYIALQLLAIVAFLFTEYRLAAVCAGVLVVGNVSITFRRFGYQSLRSFAMQNVAHYYYFCARGLSLARAVRNRQSAH